MMGGESVPCVTFPSLYTTTPNPSGAGVLVTDNWLLSIRLVGGWLNYEFYCKLLDKSGATCYTTINPNLYPKATVMLDQKKGRTNRWQT